MSEAEKVWATYAPDAGMVTVIVRENMVPKDDIAFSGFQYVFRLQPGDSVAVTQRDSFRESGAVTRFFEAKKGGGVEELMAPHGLIER